MTALVVTVATTACCGIRGDGTIPAAADLSGRSYAVGSKDFDEQIVLCHITLVALEEAGADVTDRCDTGTTDETRAALLDGDISLYWEYTGTAWASFMHEHDKLSDEDMLREVRRRDLDRSGIVWLDPARFNNTYAFAVSGRAAAALHVHTISDMMAYLRSGQPGAVCTEPEYTGRDDGLRGLQEVYGFAIPTDREHVLDKDVIYQATADDVCRFGEVYTTDGRILDLGLTVLGDDRHYHVTYAPAPTIRKDIFDRDPAVAAVLNQISAALDTRTIQTLNSAISAGRQSPEEIARTWLADRGMIAR